MAKYKAKEVVRRDCHAFQSVFFDLLHHVVKQSWSYHKTTDQTWFVMSRSKFMEDQMWIFVMHSFFFFKTVGILLVPSVVREFERTHVHLRVIVIVMKPIHMVETFQLNNSKLSNFCLILFCVRSFTNSHLTVKQKKCLLPEPAALDLSIYWYTSICWTGGHLYLIQYLCSNKNTLKLP